MQEGGVVNPDPLASDSLLQQTSSASPLLPTEGSTDSDTQEGAFDISLIDFTSLPSFADMIGMDAPQMPEMPFILQGLPEDEYGKVDGDALWNSFKPDLPHTPPSYEDYGGVLTTTEDGSETLMFDDQQRLDEYGVARQNFQTLGKEYEGYLSDLNDAQGSYASETEQFSEKAVSYLQALQRVSDPTSFANVFRKRNRETGEYSLKDLQPADAENFQYNLPGVGLTNRGDFRGSDFDEYSRYFQRGTTSDLLDALELDKRKNERYKNVLRPDGTIEKIPLASTISSGGDVYLTKEGEEWMRTTLDPEAISLAKLDVDKIQNLYNTAFNTMGAPTSDRSSAIAELSRVLGVTPGKRPSEMNSDEQRAYVASVQDAYAKMDKELKETGTEYTQGRLKGARAAVWSRKMAEKAKESFVLEYDEWKNLSSEGLGEVISGQTEEEMRSSYRDYLANMEDKIYKDLLSDPFAGMAAEYFDERGIGLFLDKETAVGYIE